MACHWPERFDFRQIFFFMNELACLMRRTRQHEPPGWLSPEAAPLNAIFIYEGPMPINNLLDYSKQMIVHTGTGTLQLDEMLETTKKFFKTRPFKNVLWDLREVIMEPMPSEAWHAMYTTLARLGQGQSLSKVAIVASDDLYHSLKKAAPAHNRHEHGESSISTFRSMPEALQWLMDAR
jgi:hypothetical protein